jgi:hypothetical protein
LKSVCTASIHYMLIYPAADLSLNFLPSFFQFSVIIFCVPPPPPYTYYKFNFCCIGPCQCFCSVD